MGTCGRNVLRAFALFLGFATLAFACVGFGTNYWLDFDVDRSLLPVEYYHLSQINEDLGRVMFSRHRGIFRECYSDDAQFLDVTDDEVDSNCFELDFEDPDDADVSDDYSARIELLRCVVAFFSVGIAFGIATIVVAIISICRRTMKWVVMSSLSALFTGLFIATALAFFLGVDHMERKDRGGSGELVFRKNWGQELEEATSTSFDWSFALSWVAVALALICALLYLVIALSMRCSRDDDDESSDSSEDKQPIDQNPYQYQYPYVINEAYQGNPSPYWSYGNLPLQTRSTLRMAVPSDYSGETMYGSQQSGTFFYGQGGSLLPAINYLPLPKQAHSHRARDKTLQGK